MQFWGPGSLKSTCQVSARTSLTAVRVVTFCQALEHSAHQVVDMTHVRLGLLTKEAMFYQGDALTPSCWTPTNLA